MEKKVRGRKTVARRTSGRTAHGATASQFAYCALKPMRERTFAPEVSARRVRLIRRLESKWANGTELHYYFFDKPTDGETVRFSDGTTRFVPWTTREAEKDVVRKAFDIWKQAGIGLEFKEVSSRSEAEIRIGFMRDDGAWSYVGRDVLGFGPDERTMNFGWDLAGSAHEIDTAIHEIGHTLGFPHEHQNPNAGIVWDEPKVYATLAKPPNRWDRETTFNNIIRKIDKALVEGSNWDPDSIMHYPFESGLIKEPPQYKRGLSPAGGLSQHDKEFVKTFYPLLTEQDYTALAPLQAVKLELAPGKQRNFVITPTETRHYELRTFGASDTVMVLFEEVNGELRFLAGDDDSGENSNAYLKVRLLQGRRYVLRLRLYYEERAGETAVMLW